MSGNYRGSNGPGTTDGTGVPGVVARVRREQRNARGARPSRRYQTMAVPTALAAGDLAQWTVTFDDPFPDEFYMATAQVTNTAGYPYGFTAVGGQTAESIVVSFRANSATPVGATIMVRAIHP